jgi:hypothetical protein
VDTPTKVFTGYERLERERLSVALLEAVEALFDPDHLRPVWQVGPCPTCMETIWDSARAYREALNG